MLKSLPEAIISGFWAIFTAMRKWLITYLFISCSICLPVCVFAGSAKTKHVTSSVKPANTISPRVFALNKASLALTDHLADNSRDIFFQQYGIRVLHSIVYYFITEPNLYLTLSCHAPGKMTNKKEVERVLKDHLLHLFPSHYFW
jgi:hypothetical protein